MNTDTAREDLAFLRSLVQPDELWQRNFGEIYAAAGACYGGQMILHGLQTFNLIPSGGPPALLVSFGPTVLLLAAVLWISRRYRGAAIGGISSRTMRSVFSAIGMANLALIAIFASVALREQNIKIWLIYAPVVLVMQGACWLTAFMLRRKAWFAVVAAGWFAIGVGMAAAIEDLRTYILIGGIGFFAFMLAPGLVMMRQARAA
jgi:hypothetical protein